MSLLIIHIPLNLQKQHESKKSTFLTETNKDSNRLLNNPLASDAASGDGTTPSYNGSAYLNDAGAASTFGIDNHDENLPKIDVEQSLRMRNFALRELVTSEETYVQDLALIVDGYMRELKDPDSDILMPDDLKGGKDRMIFGNVEAIYEWHRE